MKERINAIVKFREGFRPFAPSILDEFGDRYFEDYSATPYMEKTLKIREAYREAIPRCATSTIPAACRPCAGTGTRAFTRC